MDPESGHDRITDMSLVLDWLWDFMVRFQATAGGRVSLIKDS